jgi:hypothetical protein
MIRVLVLLAVLTGCTYTPEQVATANDRIRLTMERECATDRLAPGGGYEVPEQGMTNEYYRVTCLGYDGYTRIMWFTPMGALDRITRFKTD